MAMVVVMIELAFQQRITLLGGVERVMVLVRVLKDNQRCRLSQTSPLENAKAARHPGDHRPSNERGLTCTWAHHACTGTQHAAPRDRSRAPTTPSRGNGGSLGDGDE